MKLFRNLCKPALSALPFLAIISCFTLGSSLALADDRYHGRNNGAFNKGRDYSSNWNRSNRKSSVSQNRYQNKYINNNRGNRFNNNPITNYRRDNKNIYRSGFSNPYRYSNNYRNTRHDNWYIGLNLGSRYNYGYNNGYGFNNGWSGTGYNIGVFNNGLFGSVFTDSYRYQNPYSPNHRRNSVVINQPTVVYVNDSARDTGHVIRRSSSTAGKPGRSLLRDLDGNCFERSYDSHGIETRVQLPDSACNF